MVGSISKSSLLFVLVGYFFTRAFFDLLGPFRKDHQSSHRREVHHFTRRGFTPSRFGKKSAFAKTHQVCQRPLQTDTPPALLLAAEETHRQQTAQAGADVAVTVCRR
jgi:hypothetical protein